MDGQLLRAHPLRVPAARRGAGRPVRAPPAVPHWADLVHPGVGALRGGPVSSGPDRQPGLEGIGGALLTPGSLAIIQATFIPADRGRAIGAWSGLGGVFGAIGPLLGGFLVQAVSWRLVFVINLPLGVAAMAATRHIPETAPHQVTGRLDVSGPSSPFSAWGA